ncbi:MAG: hypothetical protein ACYS30_00375 [Planctomycetota bacterium]
MRLLRKFSKRHYFRQITAYVLMCCMFFNTSLSVALAGPEGAQVVNGQVTLQQSGYNTTITATDQSLTTAVLILRGQRLLSLSSPAVVLPC